MSNTNLMIFVNNNFLAMIISESSYIYMVNSTLNIYIILKIMDSKKYYTSLTFKLVMKH